MSARRTFPRWLPWLLGAGIAAGVLVAVGHRASPGSRPGPVASPTRGPESFPLPAFADSRYLNTGPDAHYIGTAACAECHKANHRSYLLTAHSRALSDLDPRQEPPDGTFFHQASGRSYRVHRQGNEFRHEEVLRTAEGKEVARVDLPIRYLIGSGHFTRSYIVEVDGFLHESPITWYSSKRRWDVSPGYDFARHWSFERAVTAGCLFCHAGRAEAVGGTSHRMAIREKAIGCENCHGPGSLHADRYRSGHRRADGEDLTIVNPGKLSRPLQEAICAACHLGGVASVPLRGRTEAEFRPGRPLTDFRTDYRFDAAGDRMTVVGHVEQLRQSACYRKSGELTCVTCHDPHAREQPADRVAFYRTKCLECHADKGCRLDKAERLKKDAADNCVACHMPRGDTELPHIAFTHHRIGRHAPTPPASDGRLYDLVPMGDVSGLPAIDRDRNLGLAYLEASRRPELLPHADALRQRGRNLLEGVQAVGLADDLAAAALADFYWQSDPARARPYATQALAAPDLPAAKRAATLLVLADGDMRAGNFASAAGRLEEAVRLRRFAEDWRLLGACYLMLNQPQKALPALLQALAIRPTRQATHAALAEVYRRLGDTGRAAEHQERAQWLAQHKQE